MLLHCSDCPVAFCLDCCPERYLADRQADKDAKLKASLLAKGMPDVPSTPSHFFKCDRCTTHANNHIASELNKPAAAAMTPRATPAPGGASQLLSATPASRPTARTCPGPSPPPRLHLPTPTASKSQPKVRQASLLTWAAPRATVTAESDRTASGLSLPSSGGAAGVQSTRPLNFLN